MEYPVDVLQDTEISGLSDKEFAELLKRFPVLYEMKGPVSRRLYEKEGPVSHRLVLKLMKYGIIIAGLLDGPNAVRCQQFATENCDRSLRKRHRALIEALGKYDQLPIDGIEERRRYCEGQLTDIETIGYYCREKMCGKIGMLARSGVMFRITFPDGNMHVCPLSVVEADLFEHYQDGLPVEVLQNIDILYLSKEELLEVASRFPGMRELPIGLIEKALFATKFGCFPRGTMTPVGVESHYDPPKSFVKFVNDNFIVSYGLEHGPFRRALTTPNVNSLSKDQSELRRIVCQNLVTKERLDCWAESAQHLDEYWLGSNGGFLPSMRTIEDLLNATPREAPKGFTIEDIRAGVERRKNLTKKKEKSPIVGALDKCIDSLAAVKGIASKMNV